MSGAAVSRAPTSAPFNRAPPRLCPDAPGARRSERAVANKGPAPGRGAQDRSPLGAQGLGAGQGSGQASLGGAGTEDGLGVPRALGGLLRWGS